MEHEIPYGHQSINDADIEAVVDVLRGDWLTTGPHVTQFEETLSAAIAAPCVAVSSGTAALHAAYASLDLQRHDVVLTSPLTFAATASTALLAGATVELADIDPFTLTISPEEVQARMHPAVKVIAAVDFAGTPCKLDRLLDLARDSGAVLLEDASHSVGGSYREKAIGSVADITTFSFHPVKTITTCEGGAVSSTRLDLLERIKRFRNHGLVHPPEGDGPWHQEVGELGLNYRLSDVHAALGTSQLRRLTYFKERRASLVARYRELLGPVDKARLQESVDDAEPVWHLFIVRVPAELRRGVYEHLKKRGIGVQVHYVPLHMQQGFSRLGYTRGDFPEAEKAYGEMLSLPLFPDLTERDQDRVVEELKAALRLQP